MRERMRKVSGKDGKRDKESDEWRKEVSSGSRQRTKGKLGSDIGRGIALELLCSRWIAERKAEIGVEQESVLVECHEGEGQKKVFAKFEKGLLADNSLLQHALEPSVVLPRT